MTNDWVETVGPILLPSFIFLAEICVVTLGTMRTIFIARGMKVLAPLFGFFEVAISVWACWFALDRLGFGSRTVIN